MSTSKRKYNLSPEAELIIQSRTGPPRHKGGPGSPSSSMALNSIVLRYGAMIAEQEKRNQRKFDPDELEAILAWLECRVEARHLLSLIERPQDHAKFLDLVQTGKHIRGESVLDRGRRNELVSILTKNLTASEMFALVDLGLRRVSTSSKPVTDVI